MSGKICWIFPLSTFILNGKAFVVGKLSFRKIWFHLLPFPFARIAKRFFLFFCKVIKQNKKKKKERKEITIKIKRLYLEKVPRRSSQHLQNLIIARILAELEKSFSKQLQDGIGWNICCGVLMKKKWKLL